MMLFKIAAISATALMLLANHNVRSEEYNLDPGSVEELAKNTEEAPASYVKMPLTSTRERPFGHVDYCLRHVNDCREFPAVAPVKYTAKLWETLNDVNVAVNLAINGKDDIEQYGTNEYWTVPKPDKNGVLWGDCEDYALMKRRELIKAGIHPSNLLITVAMVDTQVWDLVAPSGAKPERFMGHAVLTVITDKGEFVLDNLEYTVKPWNEKIGFRYIGRQNPRNTKLWQNIAED